MNETTYLFFNMFSGLLFTLAKSSFIFLFAIFTTIYFLFRVGQYKNVIQSLFYRSNAARIFAADYVADFMRKMKTLLCNNFLVLDNIDCNIVINESKDIKIHKVNRTLDFHNVFFTHTITFGILNACNTAIQVV